MRRSNLAFEGMLAAGAFALADALACGLPSDTMLPWWIAASGLLLGGIGAAGGAILNRPGGGTATVVLVAHGLQWGAIATKAWSHVEPRRQALLLLAIVAASAVASAIAAARLVRRSRRWSAIFLPPALVPASSLLQSVLPTAPWVRVLAAFSPAIVAALAALPADRILPRRVAISLPALLLLLLGAVGLVPPFVRSSRIVRAALAPPAAAASADAPDILMVIVDTLRADHVRGGASHPERPATPALDRLAAEGIEFTEAVSSASWTLPSHGSIFTSRTPADHGAVTPSRKMDGALPTLAGVLHDGGYATAAFTGGGFVVPATGLDAGFDEFDARAESCDHALARHTPLALRIARNRFLRIWPVVNTVPRSGGLARSTERAGRWLAQRDRSRPFFLLVHTYQLHDYFSFQADWDAREESICAARPSFAGRYQGLLVCDTHEITRGATADEAAAFERIYSHRVEVVDAAVGRLIDRVRASSGDRRLVVVFTSDHGEGFDAQSRRFMHGGRLHDDLLRVPLIVSAPGLLPGGCTIDAQVRLVDVMPTVLELAGLAPPSGLEGISLAALLRGEDDPRPAWSEDSLGAARRVSVRTPGWKVLRVGDQLEAYDLVADPLERINLSDAAPRALRERLDAFLERHPIGGARRADFDAATREQLRELGYGR